jgi:UDP-glucose 4-epimerase
MKILITGGNGYIAKSINDKLSSDYQITLASRNILDLMSNDSIDSFFDNNEKFDVVINTAVSGGSRLKGDGWGVLENNLKMYYNICSKRNYFDKLINFGSGAEIYAEHTPYGMSKNVISKSISVNDNFYNLRIFATFDENELDTRFIKSNINRYINKESIKIHTDKQMDFFYMDDLISLVDYYIKTKNPPKEMDCSYVEKYKLSQIADIINNLSPTKVDVNIDNTGPTTDYCGDGTKLNCLNLKLVGLKIGILESYNKINYRNSK